MTIYDVCAMQGDISTELRGREVRGLAIKWDSRKDCLLTLRKSLLQALTLMFDSLMDPPGAGSWVPAPSLEKTSPATESSREIPLR